MDLKDFFENNAPLIAVFVQCFTMLMAISYLENLAKTKIYFIGALGISIICSELYYYINLFSTIVFCALSILFVYYFTRKASLSTLLSVCTLILYTCADYLSDIVLKFFFSFTVLTMGETLLKLTICFIPIIIIAKQFYLYLKKKTINQNIIRLGVFISLTTMILLFSLLIIERFVERDRSIGIAHSLFIVIYGLISAVTFQILLFSFEKESKMKEKQRELKHLQLYISELEKNYTEMRRFRHDYKNILFSLESYIESKDLDGLSDYYYANIKQVSATMLENDFMLAKLSSINIKSIKALLANKLVLAQELGIETSIEIYDKIENKKIDELVIVRSLGIILDNAIEAASEIENGLLHIGLFSEDMGINIVVANSCEKNIPPLYQLKKEGYSSKGKDRGLGLSNLDRIVEKNENLSLDTKINKELFVQILSIGD